MKLFSKLWKSSKKPSKQKKYQINAPLHLKRKMLGAHLSKELRTKYNLRSIPIRKNDKVIVMRGNTKGKEGNVESVSTKNSTVHITGIDFIKKNGSKAFYPVKISNVMIKELDLSDKKRKIVLDRKNTKKTEEN